MKEEVQTFLGKIAYKLCRNFIYHFKNVSMEQVIFVTGTNGKSGTTNMMAHTFKLSGKSVVTNTEGANLITGIATILIKNSTLLRKIQKRNTNIRN